MSESLDDIEKHVLQVLENKPSSAELEQLWQDLLGKKGKLAVLLKNLKGLPAAERKRQGSLIHALRDRLDSLFCPGLPLLDKANSGSPLKTTKKAVSKKKTTSPPSALQHDVTLPGRCIPPGMPHPLRQIERNILNILAPLGFQVMDGPWVEHEWYNFTALNIHPDHPARDMQDTFFVGKEHVLRTHTSNVQIRAMQTETLPLRILSPGTVFRRDTFDATHSPVFHQMEGLWLDTKATFANLKGVLIYLLRSLFGEHVGIRFRPSFFPFTEPSCEVDIACQSCTQKNTHDHTPMTSRLDSAQACRICGGQGWLEVLGAGMVDPFVLNTLKYSPDKVRGFAFGLGLERLAMLMYEIDDIRLFYENDLRFLAQLHGQHGF
jgi:phenylalanyl-tRNA synthetase alpha chain